jgi:prepilin-type N-terminal cleavage/methylation domain-containing protein
MMNTHSKNNKGFTIIETLVAVAILMIAIAGPLTIAQKGLLAAVYARDQVIASFLAQDAMETIKNVRDSNVEQGGYWLFGLDSCLTSNNQCSVDTLSVYNVSISHCTDCTLYYQGGGGYGPQDAGLGQSIFHRSYYITTPINGSDDEARVIVSVWWNTGTVNNVVTLENEMFNIYR